MKKLFLCLVMLLAITSANAQTKREKFPFGCRVWTVGVNVGIFFFQSEVTLCCSPANWKMPPITCFELRSGAQTGNVHQYIMVQELEEKSGKKIEGTSAEVWSDEVYDDNGTKYKLKRATYPIEINDKSERFIQVLFEKI